MSIHLKLPDELIRIDLAKKALIIMIVLLATLLDKALGAEAMVFQTATVCYYIANEGLSVVENAGLMGLPVPSAIAKALEQMKEKKSDLDSKGGL